VQCKQRLAPYALREVTILPHPESAYFVIADISGYTSFLAGVELDHAQDIIADLMDTVVKGLRPPFRLAKFEGDAAFVYAATAKIDGSMLQDVIDPLISPSAAACATSNKPRFASAKPALRWAISISSSSPTMVRW
jgi:hypothetical protein